MLPLVENGYLYIAQPPLYKAKIGKKEQYLKDDKALKTFLFEWAQENTIGSINGKEIETATWRTLLEELQRYDEQINAASISFNLGSELCHALVSALHKKPWKQENGLEALLELLRAHFPKYSIQSAPAPVAVEGQKAEPRQIHFNLLRVQWDVPITFFDAPETLALLEQLNKIAPLETDPWTLKIVDKDRQLTGQGATKFITAISTISKPYMNIQRYKGLGEMNPEQLWETSMDSKTRRLLKVTIEDGLEADSWFATLMGDDVTGRKDYIEKYGHFVKNLDI
ncbi:hypothetical protein CVU75_01295, partial [Candidatus Dependentiae bacterium HGW-Dependentiae-1]